MNTVFGLGLVCLFACIGMAACGIMATGYTSPVYAGGYGYNTLGGYGLATGGSAGGLGLGGGMFGSLISLIFFMVILQTLLGDGGLFGKN